MTQSLSTIESYITVRQAAKLSGLKYHALLRAVNKQLIPSYLPFNSRRVVLLSEIRTFVGQYRQGGVK
jgi:hypothetical protein